MRTNKKNIGSIIKNLIFFIIIIVILLKLYSVYKKYYYNDFVKAIREVNVTTFTRDNIRKVF
jgi:cell division protein FtsL